MLETLTLLAALTCGQALGPPEPVAQAEPATPAAEAPAEAKPAEAPAPAPSPAPSPDRWSLMKLLQGTYPGYVLDGNRMSLSGWIEGSYTASTADVTNFPVVWNDRANEVLLQQAWVRFERTVVTSGTTTPTFGFRTDWLIGSDYRFTLPRGLWNSQLLKAPGTDPTTQNLYGVDPIAHYVEGFFPTVFQGLDVKVGRWFTPFGYESLEAVSSPFMSKSYGFNYYPPFTHYGVLATATINPIWTVQAALVNGNDVMIGDPAEEPRFVGTVKFTHPNKRDVVTFGTSLGRGRFNAGEPFAPATGSLMSEPAGRNNINVFDLVWTHVINPRVNYAVEAGYGYQTSVPANVPGGIISQDATSGTAHWGFIAQYLTVNLSPRLTSITRFEMFQDFEGQRTGFEGLYTALTFGLQYKLRPDVIFRPEIRYDYNGYSRPFNAAFTADRASHDIVTAGADLIFRW